ncbi:MAG: HD domain-containing protein [Candidatus Doudnabacteria bacterium]|nr:HD domain-containing protein [Candidatus Doudnabacteria bacterium]
MTIDKYLVMMVLMAKNRDLELLYELGALRFIPRAWKQFFNADFENLAEHHFRVAWLGLTLSKMEKRGDHAKILKMALVHDIAESRTCDVHQIGRQYTERNESLAIDDILKYTLLGQEMKKLWHEYEARKTIEAKIVKDADWLDVDLEIQEQLTRGVSGIKAWLSNREIVYKKLHTKSGKKFWQLIYQSNPQDWFKNARSRFNSGDMRPSSSPPPLARGGLRRGR